MDPFRLVIPPAVLDAMLAHARAELPSECVGFLAGTVVDGVGSVTQCLPLVNELASPTEFLTEPRSVFAAYKAMRAAGTDVLAVYHSHPTSLPVPSKKDIERNTYGPTVAWVIVGLDGDAPEVRAWWLSDTSYREAT
ncbi:MAG TPA: M67 family metallopeptidase [Fimbriiglobus sp.]|nr:M67 family metallopeptidase [Fimbriiglobus sp.]